MHKHPFPLVLSQTYGAVSRLPQLLIQLLFLERMVLMVMTFSISANTTGAFSDTTNTDSIASGDKIAVGITPGSTALVITIIAATFSSINMSNTVTHMLSFQDLISQPTIIGTYYYTIWSYSIQNIIV
jgi:putative exporter of polyketide antibiotics